MLVTVLKGQKKAVNLDGIVFDIHGAEVKKESGIRVFYAKNTSFYKAAFPDGTAHQCTVRSDGKIILE